MSTEAKINREPQENAFTQVGSFIWNFIRFWFGLAAFVVIGYLCSVCVEWVGMAVIWEEQGIQHSENMYKKEYDYINRDLANGIFRGGTLGVVDNAVAWTYEFVTPSPGGYMHQIMSLLSQPIHTSDWNIFKGGKNLTRGSIEYLHAARNIALVYVLRLTIILLSLPLFIVVVHAAMVEGMAQRERRKAGGGIESGFVYHHMKRKRTIFLIVPLVVYLASPVATHPNIVLLPIAIVLWVLNYVFVLKFKKNI